MSQIHDLVWAVTACGINAALIEQRSYKPPLASEIVLAILDGMISRFDVGIFEAFQPVTAAFVPRSSHNA